MAQLPSAPLPASSARKCLAEFCGYPQTAGAEFSDDLLEVRHLPGRPGLRRAESPGRDGHGLAHYPGRGWVEDLLPPSNRRITVCLEADGLICKFDTNESSTVLQVKSLGYLGRYGYLIMIPAAVVLD